MTAWTATRNWLADPAARRWGGASLGVLILHGLFFAFLAPGAPYDPTDPRTARRIEPIYVNITPLAREARPLPETETAPSSARPADLPPVAIRPAAPVTAPSDVAPLVVETPPEPIRPARPGRVIPQSWRARCGLGDGEVSEAAWAACRDGFLNAADPGGRPRGRGDPSQDFAAQGAARIAAYESQRAPAPTGSGNARPSATPGSNFGWGDMEDYVVYGQGERPVVNGGIE